MYEHSMPAATMCRAMALPSNLGRPSATITRNRLPALAASENTVRSRDELQKKDQTLLTISSYVAQGWLHIEFN